MFETSCSGGSTLSVGKVVCVGRNYAEHAAEMGAPRPDAPLLFLKPSTALSVGDCRVDLPVWSSDVHHEVELVVRMGREAKDAAVSGARGLVDAWAVGLDLTARDVQTQAKARGHPWAVAKGFDGSAPLSALVPMSAGWPEGPLELRVNGQVRQSGNLSDMLWSVPELIGFISSRFRLEPGDLIFTGTPSGVGAIQHGDLLEASLGPARVRVTVNDAKAS